MQDSGTALMGVGFGTNDDRAQLAAQSSISSPLLEQSTIEGATGVIVNFTASPNFAAQELENAMEIIGEAANPGQINSSQVIFGLSYNEDLEDEDGELNNNIENKFDDKKSISEEIIKLKKLYNDGFITEEEFKKAKNKILN